MSPLRHITPHIGNGAMYAGFAVEVDAETARTQFAERCSML